jgi:hypothetical protein
VDNKPYIETEGVPDNAPGFYWLNFSKKVDPRNKYRVSTYHNYINVGVYTDDMKAAQILDTKRHLDDGYGYLLASTWLQAVPPKGPNHSPDGYGTPDFPGIRWWLEFMRETYGPYKPE